MNNLLTILFGIFISLSPKVAFSSSQDLPTPPASATSSNIVSGLEIPVEQVPEGSTCSVCLNDHDDNWRELGGPVKTICGHYFHKNCLETWFNEQLSCPNCRKHIIQILEKAHIDENPSAQWCFLLGITATCYIGTFGAIYFVRH